MVLLDDRVEQQGTVPLHQRVVPLALPKINGDAALVRKRLLNTQGTLRQERMEHLRHLRRGDGAIAITHPINTYVAQALPRFERANNLRSVTTSQTLAMSLTAPTASEERERLCLSARNSTEQTSAASMAATCLRTTPETSWAVVAATILTGPTRQGPGPLPFGPAPAGERAQLTPSKVMGLVSLCSIKFARSGLKENSTSRLEVPLGYLTTVA